MESFHRAARRVAFILTAAATLAATHAAAAAPGVIHAVYWQQDIKRQPELDVFMDCFASASTTWARQFGISSVTFAGSSILQTPAPSTLTLGSTLDQALEDAFSRGLVPPPKSNELHEYVAFIPSGVKPTDLAGITLCTDLSAMGGGVVCGEHNQYAQYKGVSYDISMVPLDCNCTAMGITPYPDSPPAAAEHEAAEGLADMAGAGYEVGDNCQARFVGGMTLACCGRNYDIQKLAGSGGVKDCQKLGSAGGSCAEGGASGGGTVTDSGAGSTDSGAPSSEAGPSSSGGASQTDAGDQADGGASNPQWGKQSGCACGAAGHGASPSEQALAGFAILAALSRRRRRSRASDR